MKSMSFVNRAFAQFDTAFPLCKTPDELLTLYLERGRYFAAVPNSIFRKSRRRPTIFLRRRPSSNSGAYQPIGQPCWRTATSTRRRLSPDQGTSTRRKSISTRAAQFEHLTTGQIVALLERGIVPAALLR